MASPRAQRRCPASSSTSCAARRQGLRVRVHTAVDVGQPTACHHLKVLRRAGVVDSVRRGLWPYYSIRPEVL